MYTGIRAAKRRCCNCSKMVIASVLMCLLAPAWCSMPSTIVSAKARVTAVPTEVVEILAVGERKKVKIAVENLYPHDVQILTFLESTKAEDDKYESYRSAGPSPAEEQAAPFTVSQRLSNGEETILEQEPPEPLRTSDPTKNEDADFDREKKYRQQTDAEEAAQGELQQRKKQNRQNCSERPFNGETASYLSCAAQEKSETGPANERNKYGAYPCDWLPTSFQHSEGKSVCRLILRMKKGERAEEVKRLQNSLQLRRPKGSNFGTPNIPIQAFKGSPMAETVSSVGQRIGKLFSLEDKQARLVTAVNFLEKLELTIIQLEASTASADALAAVALRSALARSADVDFVEVDEVVYALHTTGLMTSSHNRISPRALQEQSSEFSLIDKTLETHVADNVSGADALVQPIAENLLLARQIVERVRHAGFWNSDSTDGQGPIVAVIDTGVNYLHPALARQMWVNKDEEDGIDGIDDDGNGYVDDIYGYNFFANSGDPMDVDGHGTHCAGIIAAQRGKTHFKSQGGTQFLFGVNPNARIMALKFIERQAGFLSDAARSLEYAIQHGALISSNSWGNASSLSRTLLETVQRAAGNNMLIVAASGNARGGSTPYNLDRTPLFPAALRNDNVLTVAATDLQGTLLPFSNYGRTSVPLAAPGLNIISTWLQDTYKQEAGTSQACPLVAGVASLLYSIKPHSAYSEVKHVLLSTAKRLASLNGKVTYGLVDARAAALTMEQLIQAWAVVLEAPSKIPRNGKTMITLQLLGKTPGHHQTLLKILVVYEGLPQGAVGLPVSVDVAEPFEYPTDLKIGPVVQGLVSVPTSMIMTASPDDAFTVRIAKISTNKGDTTFFGFPPPASEYRKETEKNINLLNARCRRTAPGQEQGFLTLSIQRAASFHRRQVRQQEHSDVLSSTSLEDNKRTLALPVHATESPSDQPSLRAVHEVSTELTPAHNEERNLRSEDLSSNWLLPTMKGFASFFPLAQKRPTNSGAVPRGHPIGALPACQSTTTSPTKEHITTTLATHRRISIPTQQLTIRNPQKRPSTTIQARQKAEPSLVGPPLERIPPEQPSRTTPAPLSNFHIPIGQRANRSLHMETTPANGRNSTNALSTTSATGTRYPFTELYTIKFSCEAIDIEVEPHDFSAVINPGGLKVFEIHIKKGNSLLHADAEFSVEIFQIYAMPCAGVNQESPKTPLQHPSPVNPEYEAGPTSSAEQGRVPEEECIPSLGNAGKYDTYYYFTPDKVPPAALPHVRFFWNDIREGGQRLTFPPTYAACAYRHVKLQLRFPFWGGKFEDAYVSPYGVVHTILPNYTACSPPRQPRLSKGILAPLWTPHFYHVDAMEVYFRAWEDRAIFQWEGATSTQGQKNPTFSRISFQLVLHVSGRLLFYYNNIPPNLHRMQKVAGVVSPDGLSSLLCSSAVVRSNSAVLLYPAGLFFKNLYARQKSYVSRLRQQREKHHKPNQQPRERFTVKYSGDSRSALTSFPPETGTQMYDISFHSQQVNKIDGANGNVHIDDVNDDNCGPACTTHYQGQQLGNSEITPLPETSELWDQFSTGRRSRTTYPISVSHSTSKLNTNRPILSAASFPATDSYNATARPTIAFSFIPHSTTNASPSSTRDKTANAIHSSLWTDRGYPEILRILPHTGLIPAGTSKMTVEVLAVPGLREGGTRFTGSLLFTVVSFDNKLQAVRGSGLISFNVTVPSTTLKYYEHRCA